MARTYSLKIDGKRVGVIEIDEAEFRRVVQSWLRAWVSKHGAIEAVSAQVGLEWVPDHDLAASWVSATALARLAEGTIAEQWVEAAAVERRLLTADDFLDQIETLGPTAFSSPTIGRAFLYFLADLGNKEKKRLFATIKRWAGADRAGRPRRPRHKAHEARKFMEEIKKDIWELRKANKPKIRRREQEDRDAERYRVADAQHRGFSTIAERYFAKTTDRAEALQVLRSESAPKKAAIALARLKFSEHGVTSNRIARRHVTKKRR